jgi:hypothetical protein
MGIFKKNYKRSNFLKKKNSVLRITILLWNISTTVTLDGVSPPRDFMTDMLRGVILLLVKEQEDEE